MKDHFLSLILFLCVLVQKFSSIAVPPTWITSSYVQADTQSIIKTKTGNESTPIATLPFVTAFSSLPNIGYGITDYEGGDTLGQQMLEVNRTDLTASSFSVRVQIKGYTNIFYLSVRYIAVDSAFPHKLNSFDNVPINYLNGALTNITVFSSTLTQYSNTINFTTQSIASGQTNFTQFSLPLSNNKILLFLTSFFLDGNLDSVSNPNPINMKVYTTVLTSSTYQIRATFATNVKITRLHYSMIIFDEYDVTSSELYQLVYQRVDLPGTGGFVPVPQQFISNLIMGLIQFQTSRTRTIINYRLYFQNDSNGVFGINFPYLTPRFTSYSIIAIRYGFTLFYMKTWTCPNNTFFNILTDMCQSCSLLQCVQCQSLSKCITCNQTTNYVLNYTLTCIPCPVSNCMTCRNITNCMMCNDGYYLNFTTELCEINICGDAAFQVPELCDDGNLENGDGCSGLCTIQADYSCQRNPVLGFQDSLCFYVGQITLEVILIQKTDSTNQVQILLNIGPKDAIFWLGVDFSQMVSLSDMSGLESYQVIINEDSSVLILANYNSSIHNMNIKVQLDPGKSGKSILSRYPLIQKEFLMVPIDNQQAVFYNHSSYQIFKITQFFAYIVAGSSLFFFILSIFADKLVGVQMMAVIQITHLSLMTLQGLNPGLNALANIWFVNGFSYCYLTKNYVFDVLTPIKVKGLGIYSLFIENYNITFILILAPYVIAFICILISKTGFNPQKRIQIIKLAKRCVCQYAFTGLMFSGYIISVCSVLQIMYRSNSLNGYYSVLSMCVCALMMVLILVYFIVKIKKPKNFGQFTEKFIKYGKYQQQNLIINTQEQGRFKQKINKLYYNWLIMERVAIGTSLVLMIDYKFSLLMPILVFLGFALWAIIFRPYKKLMHNIRFCCNMGITIVILTIYLLYNVTNQGKQMNPNIIWVYLPLIICILLLICIVYSGVLIIRTLVKKIKKLISENMEQKRIQITMQQQSKWLQKQSKIQSLFSKRSIQGNTEDLTQRMNYRKKLQQIRKMIKKDQALNNVAQNVQAQRSTITQYQI